jgi:signal-transduction protein with cAMP-binding, CBS, and nucleotidyltransferase domain
MLTQTAVFTRLAGDHMGPPPLVVTASDTCREVVERLRSAGVSEVIVADGKGRALGIVTEQDVSRRIACSDSDDSPIESVMSSPVFSISTNDYLYHAIARMRRLGLRHMPVVDRREKVVGVLRLHQAMAVAAAPMLAHIERLSHDDDLEGMKATRDAQAQVAVELMEDGLPGPEIQAFLSRINNDVYRGVVQFCLREMAETGLGPPPAAFDVVVMGSGGRGESFLRPDQDNGFVIEDYPPEDHGRIDPWFIELAVRVTDALAQLGFEYCRGNVMAVNPVWRKTLSEWRAQTRAWLGKSQGLCLRYCDIFFDFTCVFGSGELSRALREHITALAPHPFFLRELFKVDEEHGVALGLFQRLKTDPLPGPNRGKLNLKLTGTLPLVGAVRIMALRERVEATGTLDRIAVLHERGVLDDDEEDYLSGAYRHISRLLLRQQLADFRAGLPPGNHVPLNALSKREKDMLVDGFKAIRGFRSRLRYELTAEIF